MTGEPKIDIELDHDDKATVVVTCANCERKHRTGTDRLRSDVAIRCSCGKIIAFSEADLRRVQRRLDDLRRLPRD